MSELEKIAIGLLGMSHPEIYLSRRSSTEPATQQVEPRGAKDTPARKPTPVGTALRGLKFGVAALLAGARAVPLGDNGCITRELGEYGAYLRS